MLRIIRHGAGRPPTGARRARTRHAGFGRIRSTSQLRQIQFALKYYLLVHASSVNSEACPLLRASEFDPAR